MTAPRHFLDLDALSADALRGILEHAAAMKRARTAAGRVAPDTDAPLSGRLLAMVFEKPSTRTRVSFHVAMRQLGGESIVLVGRDTQIGRGESGADTARVLSRYADAIMVRTDDHTTMLDMAEASTVPLINGLTDRTHPCQVMADVLTFEEARGLVGGKHFAWVGAGNNMAHSWIHAAVRFGFTLRLACPEQLGPNPEVLAWAHGEGGEVAVDVSAADVVEDADCVVTDTWVSMSDSDGAKLRSLLHPYQVGAALMARAKPDALFLHCLPAHRGEEVTAEVIDGPQSAVWEEAENRIHAQKAILAWCLA
jgi:ornithine carbamoyltransferase